MVKKTEKIKEEIKKEEKPGYILGFIDFIREQGVIGLAIGFILGGAISNVVSSLVTDLINPVLGLILGSTKGLDKAYFSVFGAHILVGHFIATLINFLVIASVVYAGVKILRIEQLEKKSLPPPRLKL